MPRRAAARLLLVGSLVAIAAATLVPAPAGTARDPCSPWSLICGDVWGADFVLNVLLFLPLGLGLTARPRTVVWLGPALLSIAIELAQSTALVAREPSLRDVIANTAGGVIGGWLGRNLAAIVRPAPAAAARWLAAGATLGSIGLLAGGLLLRPSVPASTWYGQWTADLGQFDRFDGRLIEARLGRLPLGSGPLASPEIVGREAVRTGYRLAARAMAGPTAPAGIAPIVSVFDQDERQIAVLGRWRHDLVFSPRVRGQDFGFHPLWFRVGSAFGSSPAGPVDLEGRLLAGTFEGRWHRAGGEGAATVRIGPIDAWRLLIRTDRPLGRWGGAWSGALLVILLAPLGFFAARTRRGPWLLAPAAAPLAIALLPLPIGFPPAPLSDWVVASGAVLLGWLVGRGGSVRSGSAPASGGSR